MEDVTVPLRDEILLPARAMLVALFLLFGRQKLDAFGAAAAYMGSTGMPAPAVIAILVELGTSALIILGVPTRSAAMLMACYATATALIGHRFWTLGGMARTDNMIHVFKNIGIAGGFLLLTVTDPGRHVLGTRRRQGIAPGCPRA